MEVIFSSAVPFSMFIKFASDIASFSYSSLAFQGLHMLNRITDNHTDVDSLTCNKNYILTDILVSSEVL